MNPFDPFKRKSAAVASGVSPEALRNRLHNVRKLSNVSSTSLKLDESNAGFESIRSDETPAKDRDQLASYNKQVNFQELPADESQWSIDQLEDFVNVRPIVGNAASVAQEELKETIKPAKDNCMFSFSIDESVIHKSGRHEADRDERGRHQSRNMQLDSRKMSLHKRLLGVTPETTVPVPLTQSAQKSVKKTAGVYANPNAFKQKSKSFKSVRQSKTTKDKKARNSSLKTRKTAMLRAHKLLLTAEKDTNLPHMNEAEQSDDLNNRSADEILEEAANF